MAAGGLGAGADGLTEVALGGGLSLCVAAREKWRAVASRFVPMFVKVEMLRGQPRGIISGTSMGVWATSLKLRNFCRRLWTSQK
jgi:hypothetical protein